MSPSVVLKTTTVRRYSMVVEASEREAAAIEAWRKAGQAYDEHRTAGNAIRLIRAGIAVEDAKANYRDVVQKTFPPIERKTV